MKSVIKKALMAAVLLSAAAGAQAGDDWARFGRYEKANRELMVAQPESERRVVFLGNSITQFWAERHPEFFAENEFVGRGIAGQTSYQFLLRFRDDVIALHPRAVVINVATNDIAENNHVYSEDRTMGNIMSMTELARAHGIEVILTATLPAAAMYWAPDIEDVPGKIASLNSRIARYAADNGLAFVDYYTPLLGSDGVSLSAGYTDDGVHPTAAGYAVMESLILPAVRAKVP